MVKFDNIILVMPNMNQSYEICSEDEVDSVSLDKPSKSLKVILTEIILSSTMLKLQLKDIYISMIDQYPYYDKCSTNWRNSVRHTLSIERCFVKDGRLWMVEEVENEDLKIRRKIK